MQVYYMHTFIYTLVQLQLKDIYSSWLVIPRADKGMGTVNRCSSLAEGEKKKRESLLQLGDQVAPPVI